MSFECPKKMCKMLCQNGYVKDKQGCDTCECASPTLVKPISGDALSFECPKKMCKMLCQSGYVKDKQGCDTCECASPTLEKPMVNKPCAMVDCASNCEKKGADDRGCGGYCECSNDGGNAQKRSEGAKVEVDYCKGSPDQTCRMLCPPPTCESKDHCAMRSGNCCDFDCFFSSQDALKA